MFDSVIGRFAALAKKMARMLHSKIVRFWGGRASIGVFFVCLLGVNHRVNLIPQPTACWLKGRHRRLR